MIITVLSPRKGMGQTVLAINLGALISVSFSRDVLIIDTNRRYRDIENYLCRSFLTKGMDDLYCLYNAGLLTKDNFKNCVTNIHKQIDVMTSNNCFELDLPAVDALVDCASKIYNAVIIDLDSVDSRVSKRLIELSDRVIVVLNQTSGIIGDIAAQIDFYESFKRKAVFVVNRYISKKNEGDSVKYGITDMQKDLKKAGFENRVFALEYDTHLINECNDKSVLNFILNTRNKKSLYRKQMEEIITYVFEGKRQELAEKGLMKDKLLALEH